MRLVHAGYNVNMIGEVVTPAIKAGDLLILVSGSGGTETLLPFVKKAKSVGAKLVNTKANKPRNKVDFVCEVEKPLIDESITMESDGGFMTYEVTFIQHTFKKNGEFKWIMVTGIRKN